MISQEGKNILITILKVIYNNGLDDDIGGKVISSIYHMEKLNDRLGLDIEVFLKLCYDLKFITPTIPEEIPVTYVNNRWSLNKKFKREIKINDLLDGD